MSNNSNSNSNTSNIHPHANQQQQQQQQSQQQQQQRCADDHEEVLATLIRVRTRLSKAPHASLAHILAGLLPRLLHRLDQLNNKNENDVNENYDHAGVIAAGAAAADPDKQQQQQQQRQQQQQQVMGILSHALQRLESNVATIPAMPWLEAILEFLRSKKKKKIAGAVLMDEGDGDGGGKSGVASVVASAAAPASATATNLTPQQQQPQQQNDDGDDVNQAIITVVTSPPHYYHYHHHVLSETFALKFIQTGLARYQYHHHHHHPSLSSLSFPRFVDSMATILFPLLDDWYHQQLQQIKSIIIRMSSSSSTTMPSNNDNNNNNDDATSPFFLEITNKAAQERNAWFLTSWLCLDVIMAAAAASSITAAAGNSGGSIRTVPFLFQDWDNVTANGLSVLERMAAPTTTTASTTSIYTNHRDSTTTMMMRMSHDERASDDTVASAAAAQNKNNNASALVGVLDLILDLMLFWPLDDEHDQYHHQEQQRRRRQGRGGGGGGMLDLLLLQAAPPHPHARIRMDRQPQQGGGGGGRRRRRRGMQQQLEDEDDMLDDDDNDEEDEVDEEAVVRDHGRHNNNDDNDDDDGQEERDARDSDFVKHLPVWLTQHMESQRGLSSEGEYRMNYRLHLAEFKARFHHRRHVHNNNDNNNITANTNNNNNNNVTTNSDHNIDNYLYDDQHDVLMMTTMDRSAIPRGNVWNEAAISYLKDLKYACLHYCIWPPPTPPPRPRQEGAAAAAVAAGDDGGGGRSNNNNNKEQSLFQGDSALLLAVMAVASSSNQSKHGQLAADYINKLSSSSHPYPQQQEDLRPKPSSFLKQQKQSLRRADQRKGSIMPQQPFRVSLSLVCSLMILVIGDEFAAPVLEKFGKTAATNGNNTVAKMTDDDDDDDVSYLWEDILGPRPNTKKSPHHCRPPLPTSMVASVMDFISSVMMTTATTKRRTMTTTTAVAAMKKQRIVNSNNSNNMALDLQTAKHPNQGVLLFLELIQAGELLFRSDNIWVVHIIRGLYHQIMEQRHDPNQKDNVGISGKKNDVGWFNNVCQKCFEIAMNHLSMMARWSSVLKALNPEQLQQQLEEQRGGLLALLQFFPHRRDMDRLVVQHRLQQSKQVLARPSAVHVRDSAYGLISDLVLFANRDSGTGASSVVFGGGNSNRQGNSETLSFEVPSVLFTCVEFEPAEAMNNAATALDNVLTAYQQRILTLKSHATPSPVTAAAAAAASPGPGLESLAAPLLRILASASCSASTVIRMASAKWTAGLLSYMDPMSAYTLATFLTKDRDSTISQFIKQGTWYKSLVSSTKNAIGVKLSKSLPVTFVDYNDFTERSLLEAELNAEVLKVSNALEIPAGAASLLLHDFDFKVEETIQSTKADRQGTFQKAGLFLRLNNGDGHPSTMTKTADSNLHTCGICYDEFMDEEDNSMMHSLPCHHEFCRECWKELLMSTKEEHVLSFMKLTCPAQNCSERLTSEDIGKIDIDFLPTWRTSFLFSYIERSQGRRRFCPGPDCTMVALAPLPAFHSDRTSATLPAAAASVAATPPSAAASAASVKCIRCQTQFCISCGEVPHIPARCQDMTKFNRLYTSTSFWIQKNTKPCPGCSATVHKDGGCNAMICTRCNASFCWLCLTIMDDAHVAHTCNNSKYTSGRMTTDEQRFVFYSERYQAHDHAEQYTRRQIIHLEERAADVSHVVWNLLTDQDLLTFQNGLETLIRARRFLKYSYVRSFGSSTGGKDDDDGDDGDDDALLASSGSSSNNRTRASNTRMAFLIWERYQGCLESSTEELSRLTEMDLDQIYYQESNNNNNNNDNNGGVQGIKSHFGALGLYTEFVTNAIERMMAIK